MLTNLHTSDIREEFKRLLAEGKFTTVGREATMTSLVGSRTIEIVGSTFIADEESIFGTVNQEYVTREEQWYDSMSLNVNDIPGGAPAVWKAVADKDGFINSNYGFLIYNSLNGFDQATQEKLGYSYKIEQEQPNQYKSAVAELWANPESRRAMMIYTRPSIWLEYNLNGRSDFICTNSVQYLIRDGKVHAVVNMRSSDAIFGFKNDRAWALHVLKKVTTQLNDWTTARIASGLEQTHPIYEIGNIYWQSGSIHVYARHFHLVDPSFNKETT